MCLYACATRTNQAKIICYSASGEPLNRDQALAAVQEAIDEIDRGEAVPMEEVMRLLDEEFGLR